MLASVAAILPPTWPDLPMPVTTMRPAVSRHILEAFAKFSSRRVMRSPTARDSMSSTRAASDMSSLVDGLFKDGPPAGICYQTPILTFCTTT